MQFLTRQSHVPTLSTDSQKKRLISHAEMSLGCSTGTTTKENYSALSQAFYELGEEKESQNERAAFCRKHFGVLVFLVLIMSCSYIHATYLLFSIANSCGNCLLLLQPTAWKRTSHLSCILSLGAAPGSPTGISSEGQTAPYFP